MLATILAAVLCLQSAEFPSYEQAYAQSQRENRPLLVLVSARWCAACQVMKRETLIPMRDQKEFKNAVVTIVDVDDQPQIAQQLMRGKTLPQLVLMQREPSGWKRFLLTGRQDRPRILELLQKIRSR